MADNAIRRQDGKTYGLTVGGCLKMFGVSKSGYYAWKKRREDNEKRKEEERKELRQIMGRFRAVVKELGFVPGKRTFRTYMFREYGSNISVKRCRNLVASLPKKDAYKGQAAYNHRAASPDNKVKQDFYIGPRKVVLADITYFYCGRHRSVLYMCAFRDAYTREILGCAVGTRLGRD